MEPSDPYQGGSSSETGFQSQTPCEGSQPRAKLVATVLDLSSLVLYIHRDKVDILDAFREDAFTRSSVILTKLETKPAVRVTSQKGYSTSGN